MKRITKRSKNLGNEHNITKEPAKKRVKQDASEEDVSFEIGDGSTTHPFRLPLRKTANSSGCLHCKEDACVCQEFGTLLEETYSSLALKRQTEVGTRRELCAKSILPEFVSRLVRIADVNDRSVFYDFGCGNGSVLFQIAYMTGAKCVGFEINPVNVKVAQEAWDVLKPKLEKKSGKTLDVSIMCMDFCQFLRETPDFFARPSVIWAANLLLPRMTNHYLAEQFRLTSVGTQILCFEDFYPHSRSLCRMRDPEVFELFEMKDYLWQPMSVEWCCMDGRFYYYKPFENKSILLDVVDNLVVRNYNAQPVSRHGTCYCPISETVAVHQLNSCLLHFSPHTQQPVVRSFLPDVVTAAACTSDGLLLICGTSSGSIFAWNTSTGQLLKNFKAHQRVITCLSISSDSSLIASVSEDSLCKIWSLESVVMLKHKEARPISLFSGHTLPINVCAFFHHGPFLVTGSNDKTCRVIDARTGEQIKLITVGDEVTAAAVHFSDDKLVIGTGKGHLVFRTMYSADRKEDISLLAETQKESQGSPVVFLSYGTPKSSDNVRCVNENAVFTEYCANGRIVGDFFPKQKQQKVLSCCLFERPMSQVKIPVPTSSKNPLDENTKSYVLVKNVIASKKRNRNARSKDSRNLVDQTNTTSFEETIKELQDIENELQELKELKRQILEKTEKLQ